MACSTSLVRFLPACVVAFAGCVAPTQPYPQEGQPPQQAPAANEPAAEAPAEPVDETSAAEPPPANPSNDSSATPGLSRSASELLAAHNRARAEHCAPALQWSAELEAFAADWATRLRDRGCAMEHRQGSPHGENLSYRFPAGSGSAENVVGAWVDERRLYDFSNPGFSMKTGHFTQVVWRGTQALGCATVRCGDQAELWVCNYSPPGNMRGQYQINVLPQSCSR